MIGRHPYERGSTTGVPAGARDCAHLNHVGIDEALFPTEAFNAGVAPAPQPSGRLHLSPIRCHFFRRTPCRCVPSPGRGGIFIRLRDKPPSNPAQDEANRFPSVSVSPLRHVPTIGESRAANPEIIAAGSESRDPRC